MHLCKLAGFFDILKRNFLTQQKFCSNLYKAFYGKLPARLNSATETIVTLIVNVDVVECLRGGMNDC